MFKTELYVRNKIKITMDKQKINVYVAPLLVPNRT